MTTAKTLSALPQHRSHSRKYELNRFVYPVLSRRSRGISIGVNLNPDKVCNFDCIYCQVDRVSAAETKFVELSQLLDELDHVLGLVTSGELFEHSRFAATPAAFRRTGPSPRRPTRALARLRCQRK